MSPVTQVHVFPDGHVPPPDVHWASVVHDIGEYVVVPTVATQSWVVVLQVLPPVVQLVQKPELHFGVVILSFLHLPRLLQPSDGLCEIT